MTSPQAAIVVMGEGAQQSVIANKNYDFSEEV